MQRQGENIGIVSLVPMNGWNANISYEKLNIVTHKNSTFIAKRANKGIEPFVASSWEDVWMALVSGVGISTTVSEYATTDVTSQKPPETGWSTEIPALKAGEYLWVRVTITYTDGKQTTFYSVGAGGVPTKMSDLSNDGDGTSPFATEKQLQAEKERAEAAEGANKNAIEAETTRAQAVEQANAEAIQSEAARAKAAEAAEKTRAEGAETAIGNRITTIENKIPEQASASNKLADQAFVNSSINALAAFFITPTASGDEAWATRAALLAATTFYNGEKTRVPTQNDYAIVLADESKPKGVDGTYPTTRYSYQGGTYPNGQWVFQYIVNNTSLTQAQVTAVNSGITAALVAQITTNKNSIAALSAMVGTAVQSATGSNGIIVSKSGTAFTISGVTAETNTIGVAYLHKAQDCTVFTSDNGGATPAAVRKAIITEATQLNELFNATSTHRGTMSKEDKIKFDAFGEADTYATQKELDDVKTTANNAMPKSGGTFTGGISVTGGASINTSGYVVGTWLATTKATDLGSSAQKIAVIGTSGTAMNYIYYRTPEEIRGDIGAGTYSKPKDGIPADDLEATLKNLINGALQKTGGVMTGRLVINKAGSAPADANAGHIAFQKNGAEYGRIRLTTSNSNLAIESKGGIILYGGTDFNGSAYQNANYISILSGSVAATGVMDLTGFRNLGLSGTISHGGATLTLPTETGTIALTKQIPSLTNYYTKTETNQQINSAISSAITTALNTPV